MVLKATLSALIAANRKGLVVPGDQAWDSHKVGSVVSAPVNLTLPVITGTTNVGDTLTSSTGAWDGIPAPTYTYQWRRDGVDIAGQTAATHVIVIADLGTNLTHEVTATNAVGSAMAESAATAIPDLPAQILTLVAAASWTAHFIGLSRDATDFNLSGSAVIDWYDWSGLGNHATQATAGARPAYSATAVNSKPGMTLDGGDTLLTPAITTNATAWVLMVLYQRSAGSYAANFMASAAERVTHRNTLNGAGSISGEIQHGGVSGSVWSVATTYPMTSPEVVTLTTDFALGIGVESRIRHAGGDVTKAQSGVDHAATTIAAATLCIGGYDNTVGAAITGAIAACVLLSGTTAVPTTQVGKIEELLRAQQGLITN